MILYFALLGRTENIKSENYFVWKVEEMPSELLERTESHFVTNTAKVNKQTSTEAIKQENVSIMYIFQTHITLITQDNILKLLSPFQNSIFTQAI